MVRLRLAEPPPDGGLWSSRKVADVLAAHLGLENAGPDGSRRVHLPPDSPELQPAETLWPLVDEPVV